MTHPPRPQVVGRAEWGAGESQWPLEYFPLQMIVVHHTAWPDRIGEPADAVRKIHRLHAVERGWGDIGYGYVIAPDGTVFEGRSGDPPAAHAAAGAHVLDHNAGSLGVALLGTFGHSEPSTAATESLVALLAFETGRAGFAPTASVLYANPVSGRTAMVPAIAAHRDLAPTECPGEALHRALPGIRLATRAASRSPSARA